MGDATALCKSTAICLALLTDTIQAANPAGEVGTGGWEGVCVLRFLSYNQAKAASTTVATWHFLSEIQEWCGCQSLEQQQTSPLGVVWKSAPKKCILMLNYSNGLASCPDNLHATLLVEEILDILLNHEAVGLRVSMVSVPVPSLSHQGSFGVSSAVMLQVQPSVMCISTPGKCLSRHC